MHRERMREREGKTSTEKKYKANSQPYETRLLVILIPYTIYELSILYGCANIFDEKGREKEKGTNKGKNKQEKPGSQSHYTTNHY